MRWASFVLSLLALMPCLAQPGPKVCQARESLRDQLPSATPEQRARMFRAFRTLYFDSVFKDISAWQTTMAPYETDLESWLSDKPNPTAEQVQNFLRTRPDIRAAGAPWFDCGYIIAAGEGESYPATTYTTLLEFADQLPPDLAAFTRFDAAENSQPIVEDDTLQLSWEELCQRLTRWEAFARQHPDLLETGSEVKPTVKQLATFLIFGLDNTPTFDYTTGAVLPEVTASWRHFAQQDKSSAYHDLVETLSHRESLTEDDRPLFAEADLTPAFDQWLRTRAIITHSKNF